MKKYAIVILLFAAAILAVYQWYYADPNIIDEEYISSDSYQVLQQNIAFEKSKITDRETVLKKVVQKMLARDAAFQRTLPYRLDSLALDSVMKDENRLSIPEFRIKPSDLSEYTFYGLTIFESEEYRALLSLIELPGVYRDLEVGLTTVRDGEIIDIAMVGRFQRNISLETHTEIYIGNEREIRVKVDQSRFYPFEQDKSVRYRYLIANDGRIEYSIL